MYLGIDVGSVSTDAVLLDDNCKIIASSVLCSGFDHAKAIQLATNNVCTLAEIDYHDIKAIVSTGYGRRTVKNASKTITEISCHAKGMHYQNKDIRMLIDIGGQDSKIILLGKDGDVKTFIMNDKCAAGTGRFLEVMAHAMGVDISLFGEISANASKAQSINNVCTVFAETEVISLIAQGFPKEEIIAGIHKAVADRVLNMASSIGLVTPVALSGGVAKNLGIIKVIRQKIGEEVYIPHNPQIIGAIGAALYARNIKK